MLSNYQAFKTLSAHRAQLRDSLVLGTGIQLAAWSNKRDTITQRSDHHTLSLYVADGYETWLKVPGGWRNGGGPGRFCLMPEQSEYTWDVRGDLSFVHLYCTDQHLRAVAEQIWDRGPAQLGLEEKTFAEDERIAWMYRHLLLNCDWRQQENQLQLSSASTLLLIHLVRHYSTVRWRLPTVTGGLAPAVLRRVEAWIEAHLGQTITLAMLAREADLSEFHFARMFSRSLGMAPHRYVMQRRLLRAEQLVRNSGLPLTEIALSCGFSSASHFSNRFRAAFGATASQLRAASR